METQLEDISGMPDTWNELYKTFINIAWNGLGKKDKINLLKPYFNDLKPSEGYLAIKYLIEHGYVQNIITTNFDPLIDKILENIPHRKIVGELTSELGDNPKITFIKAHGDLKYGNLRFSPFELQKLPAELENKIRQLTKGIVIVVGYRGQDIGIMNSLNTSDDHCAFWVSPTKPEIYDGYTNDPIYDWMKKRNSEGNFIYGEYGDFNILFPTLVRKLSALPNETFKTVEIWKNSFLFDIQGLIEQKKQSGYIYDSAKYILIQFDKFCVENHIDRAIITKELSDTWLSYHADEAKSRRASRMSVLRQLVQYMNSQGSECYIPSKFSAKSYRVPYVMNEREIREFFTVADDYIPKVNADRFSILAEEYKVLFRFIYCCGLRVSEARKLKLEDIDFERKTALILRSKGDKDRLIYIADDVCNMCLDMLDLLHDKYHFYSEYLFPSSDPNTPLQVASINKKFQEFCNNIVYICF